MQKPHELSSGIHGKPPCSFFSAAGVARISSRNSKRLIKAGGMGGTSFWATLFFKTGWGGRKKGREESLPPLRKEQHLYLTTKVATADPVLPALSFPRTVMVYVRGVVPVLVIERARVNEYVPVAPTAKVPLGTTVPLLSTME